jgi:hypothetical protein
MKNDAIASQPSDPPAAWREALGLLDRDLRRRGAHHASLLQGGWQEVPIAEIAAPAS